MSALGNSVLDNGLNYIDTATENLYLLSADPGLVWANIATYALGVKASPVISAPADRTLGGREVIVSAITDGSATVTGDATHYALTDDSASDILVVGTLTSTLSVTNGSVFATESFTVGIPDPA